MATSATITIHPSQFPDAIRRDLESPSQDDDTMVRKLRRELK